MRSVVHLQFSLSAADAASYDALCMTHGMKRTEFFRFLVQALREHPPPWLHDPEARPDTPLLTVAEDLMVQHAAMYDNLMTLRASVALLKDSIGRADDSVRQMTTPAP